MAIQCQNCRKTFKGPDYDGFDEHVCPRTRGDAVDAFLNLALVISFFILIIVKGCK